MKPISSFFDRTLKTLPSSVNFNPAKIPLLNVILPGLLAFLLVLATVSPGLGQESLILPNDQVVASIPVGRGPYDIAISPDSSNVYVANYLASTVSVIDAKTNTVRITVSVGKLPLSLGLTPNGGKLYVHNIYDGTVSDLNAAKNTVSGTFQGPGGFGLGVSPDGTRLYVTSNAGVSIFDTATDKPAGTVASYPVSSVPQWVAFTPDGAAAYVLNFNTVTMVLTATKTVGVPSIVLNTQGPASGMALCQLCGRLYVTAFSSVGIIDLKSNQLISSVAVTQSLILGRPGLIPDGKILYIPIYKVHVGRFAEPGHQVVMLDTATDQVAATRLTVGAGPEAVAVAPDGGHAYVANYNANTVSVIRIGAH